MRYVVEQFWIFTAVAFVIGLTAGWVAARQPNPDRSGGWVQAYIALVIAAGVVVYGGWLRGAAGLWFETAVLLGAAYLAGCILGSLIAPSTPGPAAPETPPNP